jgi:ribosomal protein S18 acetylase RimI-like enzyme
VPKPGELTFRRYDGPQAAERRDDIEQVYRKAYRAAIESGDPFDSVEAFMNRFDHYARIDGFDLVVLYSDGTPIGQTWGWPLKTNASWWGGLEREPEPGFTDEDGSRTFALSEIMVGEEFAGQGLAHRVHDELLRPRGERRATLLVEPDNDRARRAYVRWGWQPVSTLRPNWVDAPQFEVLVRPLPLLDQAQS